MFNLRPQSYKSLRPIGKTLCDVEPAEDCWRTFLSVKKAGKTGLKTFSLLSFSRLSHDKNMLFNFGRF